MSERLKLDIEEGKEMPVTTEKAKSENIIAPIMRELKRKNPDITVFSGFALIVEDDKDLTGNPDFVLSKNKIPDEGYAQCAAEMYAARLINKVAGKEVDVIYGAVTSAFDWVFMKLEGNTVYIDLERRYLIQLEELP